ncbi:UTRA domain-containing protein [Rhodovarius crocodyli]|uniref:UTRA domain-containing protein n=1 Tax=Rhodovarius crocodyli TaxID=1979269 RepID=A0A437MER8_9PROT|nr:UTRA domain-containing protein [Rhodovarius crocodyli]RVT96144.1 UTRA domain-containing protein [Rhodovarius crocodyli]
MPDGAQPLYVAVKAHVRGQIASGAWPPGFRIPSENQLGPMLGVSRITVNRAFAELARDGVLTKVPGVGTFVAKDKPRFGLFSIQDIALEIAARGMGWAAQVLTLGTAQAPRDVADAMGMPAGSAMPHSLVLHLGDDTPIQLEERWVRPGYAPGFLAQDYAATTTFALLAREGRPMEMEQTITAVLPDAAQARLLKVSRQEPCLVIRRRTFTDGEVMTFSRLIQPAARFEISGRAALSPDGSAA